LKIQTSAADCAVQVHGGQLSLTFSYTIWVDQHASLNRIYLKSAVWKIVKLSRISFFKKTAQTSFLGGSWGEEHVAINDFQKFEFFSVTGPLFKIGGFLMILESNWAQ